uniref:Uncharacterized protein n=1 Tax=Anopheles minimus TaxID=112268 RepID=A0A182WNS3_9DIPT
MLRRYASPAPDRTARCTGMCQPFPHRSS